MANRDSVEGLIHREDNMKTYIYDEEMEDVGPKRKKKDTKCSGKNGQKWPQH
jgi:hypothetical protein